MAPERALGLEVGPEGDLYSLDVIAFELMVGRTPFHDTEAPMAILMRQINDPIPPVTYVVPNVDPAISDWVQRLAGSALTARPARADRDVPHGRIGALRYGGARQAARQPRRRRPHARALPSQFLLLTVFTRLVLGAIYLVLAVDILVADRRRLRPLAGALREG